MGLTSLLTLIAFAFSVSDLLPRISYPIFIDNIFIMCYFFVLFVIMAVLIETYYDQNGYNERALKIHRYSRPVFLIGFLLATYFIALMSEL
ncbi:MAG: hypothetical protein Q9M28_05810 [Mariprofundaceae bacterium]|nr:hypothetical protein [Mariprofundaceae bacterium]